ncbi:peptide chain release factor N(5)-glutamine methyltransferase [Fulvivirga sp. M361]|uniref:peptide chain release factor N(5)-glutamine methyltransferase n=1 Tax=Fulvivirga sp. M361 TaxID=2594266 RepID=UPI00117B3A7A|nr:peptide chain release factor N(5)-glutamine methyltransferase [Fulvivirga sp. M361]TRX50953.1 peptide chain release factor N(5)-glutamine methyltransferase [Fulvivirga sp. M361]
MAEILPNSSKKLLQYILDRIDIPETKQEVGQIANLIIEHIFNLDRAEIIVDRSLNMTSKEKKMLDGYIDRVNNNEPIQYILEEAEFYGRKFMVNASVLIPRNETEELVALIVKENKEKKIKFLDIGTGSGCIAITLAKELKEPKSVAMDFDPRVIKTARANASKLDTEVEFLLIDILTEPIPGGSFDLIVSNPPYIRRSEKEQMKPNVLDHEPGMALFVNDNDPLIFYRRIGELAQAALKDGGKLYFEVNENFADDTKVMLEVMGYTSVDVIQDINGKDRIVRGLWSNDLFAQPEGF